MEQSTVYSNCSSSKCAQSCKATINKLVTYKFYYFQLLVLIWSYIQSPFRLLGGTSR